MKNVWLFALVVSAAVSCSKGAHVFPARQSEVRMAQVITPIKIVDYSVDLSKKIEGIAEGYITKSSGLELFKEQAIINACNSSNVDLLIDPSFTVTTKGAMVTVIVKGYAAKYTDVRSAVPADSIHLKYGNIFQAPSSRGSGKIKLIY